MKKLNFNVANLGATEVLSREELKKVLGGVTTGAGSGSCDTNVLRDSTGKALVGKPCDGKAHNDSCSYYRYNTSCELYSNSGTCDYILGYFTCNCLA